MWIHTATPQAGSDSTFVCRSSALRLSPHTLKIMGSRQIALIARGFGATHFIARNETADGRAQNRRIELMLME